MNRNGSAAVPNFGRGFSSGEAAECIFENTLSVDADFAVLVKL